MCEQKVTYLGRMAGNHPFEMLASSFCIPDNELSPCTKYFSNKGIPDKTPSTISNLKAPDNFVPFQKYDRNELLGLSQKNGHLQSLQAHIKYCWEILEDDLALVALYVHLQYNSGSGYGCEDVFKKNRMNPFLCRCLHFA